LKVTPQARRNGAPPHGTGAQVRFAVTSGSPAMAGFPVQYYLLGEATKKKGELRPPSFFGFCSGGLLVPEISHFEIIFFYEFINIRAIFPCQFGRLADVAPGKFKQLNEIIFFKILLGILK
jgi:hypothetical protein